MSSYLNYGVSDVKQDFRDELTELVKGRIDKDLELLKRKFKYIKDVSVDLDIGDCPLGWDVFIYFKDSGMCKNISQMLFVAETVAKTIGVDFCASSVEWENVFNFEENFTRIYYCADLVAYRENS